MNAPKHRIIGEWSVRAFQTSTGNATGYHVFPVGERSHWAIKATLWPASDGKCFVISMDRAATDARPTLDSALAYTIGVLDRRYPRAAS